jgi:hypothetical protein
MSMEYKAWLVVCGVAVSVVAFGCRQEREPATTTTTTAALSHDDAVMRVATARCDREAGCNEIGPGKKYPDRDACMREAGQNTRGTLRADQCPRIDESKLSACLNDIKAERCGNLLDKLDTVTSCTRSKICLDQ